MNKTNNKESWTIIYPVLVVALGWLLTYTVINGGL